MVPLMFCSVLLGFALPLLTGNAAYALAQAEATFSLANRLGVSDFQASRVPGGGYINGKIIESAHESLVEAKSHSQRLSRISMPVEPDNVLDALISETRPVPSGYNSDFRGFYSRVHGVVQEYRSRAYRYPRYGAVFDFSLNLAIAEGQSSINDPAARNYARAALLNAAEWAKHKDISSIINPAPLFDIAQKISSGSDHMSVYNDIVRWRENYKSQFQSTTQI